MLLAAPSESLNSSDRWVDRTGPRDLLCERSCGSDPRRWSPRQHDLVSNRVPRCDRFVDCCGVGGANAYGTVTLPDPSIVTELQSRGQVFRTDVDDAACGRNPNKIGPDADGEPGGCTNIRIVLKDGGPPQVSVWNGS